MMRTTTMQEPHRYALDKGSKHPKIDCPHCHAKKHWRRYEDKHTGELLPDQYGCCDNAEKCGQWLDPRKDGYAKMIREQERGQYWGNWKPAARISPPKPLPKLDPVFIPPDVLRATLKGYGANVFLNNLMQRIAYPFAEEDIEKVVGQYYLGTTSRGFWDGAITFPYIDIHHRTRAIQVKKFDEHNHTTKTTFIHSIIEKHHRENNKPLPDWVEPYQRNELKVSCLFGEYLLAKYPNNPVALVEAPKTAVYATLYFGFPDDPSKLLWLAVYNLSSLNYAKCRELEGRKVFLFPDLSKDGHAFNSWSSKAKELERLIPGSRFKVSDLLGEIGQPKQRQDGADLADYLIKLDWRRFRNQSSGLPQPPKPEVQPAQPAPRTTHQYCPAAIAGLIASPHHFTSIEAVDEIAAKVPEPFWYDALLDYCAAMETPAPEVSARAYLKVFHKLRSPPNGTPIPTKTGTFCKQQELTKARE